MNVQENEAKISALQNVLLSVTASAEEIESARVELDKLMRETYSDLTAWDRVCIARSKRRITAKALIAKLFTDFTELKGDRYYGDDESIIAGLGFLKDMPVTVIAQAKGSDTGESIRRNFGMTSPEGFRKALRLAKQAEKFKRPIITIVDTSGAYPGKGAEERGQARAIAENLMEFSRLRTPVIALVLSEGGSGGALALTVSDYIYMFGNAVYSVLSPEGLSSILFKNTLNIKEICEHMKLTAADLKEKHIVDEIIDEPLGGITSVSDGFANMLASKLAQKLKELSAVDTDALVKARYGKFRGI